MKKITAYSTEKIEKSKVRSLILATVAGASLVTCGLTGADDTEIFFAEDLSAEDTTATVMFMFDLSGSMHEFDGGSLYRLARLKQAMTSVVETAENINIGVGSFTWGIGSVELPAVNVSEDLCVNASCSSVKIRGEIKHVNDDAHEFLNGTVELNTPTIEYETDPYLWGLRFDNLNIPRGARINSASLQILPNWNANGYTRLTIAGEAADDSAPFANVNYDLSRRMAPGQGTSASVDWEPGDWFYDWYETRDYFSPNISSVVSEITDRNGWCGGNALTLLVRGEGAGRWTWSHENDPFQSAVLQIDYDPSGVDWSDTCLSNKSVSSIAGDLDDVIEGVSSGVVSADGNQVRTHIGTEPQVIGLRFTDIDIPAGATISEAYISLNLDSAIAGNVNLIIGAEDTSFSTSLNPSLPRALTDRSFMAQTVRWDNLPADHNKLKSPDISALVSNIVSRPGWAEKGAMTFALTPTAGSTGQRFFTAVDSPTDMGARLVVHYQQNGTESGGVPPVLVTGRDEIIRTLMDYEYGGSTPLAHGFYEAAQYMLGGPASYGASMSGNYPAPGFGECNANQIVLLTDGVATVNNIKPAISSLTGRSCRGRSNAREDCMVELAGWLYETDHDPDTAGIQSVVTNTIGFNVSGPILDEIAEAGGGSYYEASSGAELSAVFRNIIESAITQDVSFVAPSSALSLTNRLVNSNELYFGLFKPATTTVWDGNVKRYELAANPDSGELEIRDALSMLATNPDGTIRDTARSFWSTDTDGGEVGLGGAASRLTLTRRLFTSFYDDAVADTVLVPFHEDTAAIGLEVLGIPGQSTAYRNELLRWARGVDVKDNDGDSDVTEVRTQMGDPMHSTQYLMYYAGEQTAAATETTEATFADARTLLFIGTNQGFLHAIDTEDGSEAFAFIPEELLGNLDSYYRNEVVAHDRRPYGLDGEVTGWHDDTNDNLLIDDGEKAYIYVGMRRGGRNYYALDVSDADNPQFAWKIEGGQGEFAELGQTWSRPVKAKVKYLGADRDVLFFAAGYDDSNDEETVRTPDTTGRGFFMVDAVDGSLLGSWDHRNFSDMDYSIPSDLRIIDPDGDTYANTIYVGDTGGQVWRFDINNAATTASAFITGHVIADVGGASSLEDRRFFYEPDLALIRNPSGGVFLNIGIGSGSRPNPNSKTVEDSFYSFRDYNVFGPPRDADQVVTYPATMTEADLVDATESLGSSDTTGSLAKGWFFRLPGDGEKSLSTALTIDSQLMFTTYVPAPPSDDICAANIGSGRIYTLNILNGDPVNGSETLSERYVELERPGIPPRVVGLMVEALPNKISKLVGTQTIGGSIDNEEFERIFWAEE